MMSSTEGSLKLHRWFLTNQLFSSEFRGLLLKFYFTEWLRLERIFWRTSGPILLQVHLELPAQEHVQMTSEYLKG